MANSVRDTISLWCMLFYEVFNYMLERFTTLNKPYVQRSISDCIVVVTGANSGIGKATAIEFANKGATTVLACRNVKEGQKVIDTILKTKPTVDKTKLDLLELDLSKLSSVREFAKIFKIKYPRLDILVNNAGIFDTSGIWKKTSDGFESHIGVNHLGHFLLTNLLIDHIKKGHASRVITVSSSLQRFASSKFDLTDLMVTKTKEWSFFNALPYGLSKYCNSLFAKKLQEKLNEDGNGQMLSYSLCPGYVDSGLFRDYSFAKQLITNLTVKLMGLTIEQGCATTMYLACAEDPPPGGKFYRLRKLHPQINQELKDNLANDLWEESAKLVGL